MDFNPLLLTLASRVSAGPGMGAVVTNDTLNLPNRTLYALAPGHLPNPVAVWAPTQPHFPYGLIVDPD